MRAKRNLGFWDTNPRSSLGLRHLWKRYFASVWSHSQLCKLWEVSPRFSESPTLLFIFSVLNHILSTVFKMELTMLVLPYTLWIKYRLILFIILVFTAEHTLDQISSDIITLVFKEQLYSALYIFFSKSYFINCFKMELTMPVLLNTLWIKYRLILSY